MAALAAMSLLGSALRSAAQQNPAEPTASPDTQAPADTTASPDTPQAPAAETPLSPPPAAQADPPPAAPPTAAPQQPAALAHPIFHHDGVFDASIALRNLYLEVSDLGAKGLSLWAGSRMCTTWTRGS
ncbi:hypothetical protein [Sorangium sp. So ce1097]|uniref:hypothetical protein n=1 Tax=Sorangium sp. So ce1097 TaxID=3133330 RepID=UPI003F5FAA70